MVVDDLIVAVSGDFDVTGIVSTVQLASLEVTTDVASGTASGDPMIRQVGDELFIVNRFGADNITILDATTLQLVDQISTGAGSNPQDVAVVGDRLYVPALGTAGVVVIDRGAGNALSTIDLGALDPDELPNCISAYELDGEVFVACGVLDDDDPFLSPRGDGVIAVIDTADDSLARDFELPGANPVGWLALTSDDSELAGDLVIGLVPSYNDFSIGCLARVPRVGADATCVVTNQELGGYANRLASSSNGGILWIAVNGFDESFNGFGMLRGLDAETLELWDGQVSGASQSIKDLAVCPSGDIVVADRPDVGASGLRVYSGETTLEVTDGLLDIGLPPSFGNGLVCY
jgi:hypothetical protein